MFWITAENVNELFVFDLSGNLLWASDYITFLIFSHVTVPNETLLADVTPIVLEKSVEHLEEMCFIIILFFFSFLLLHKLNLFMPSAAKV